MGFEDGPVRKLKWCDGEVWRKRLPLSFNDLHGPWRREECKMELGQISQDAMMWRETFTKGSSTMSIGPDDTVRLLLHDIPYIGFFEEASSDDKRDKIRWHDGDVWEKGDSRTE